MFFNLSDKVKEDLKFYWLFIKLSIIGIGGPIALMALIEQEFLKKHRYITEQEFVEGFAIAQLLPGPLSTKLGIYIGYIRKGYLGGIIAGLLYTIPCMLIIFTITVFYSGSGKLYNLDTMFYYLMPAVTAIVFNSMIRIAKLCVKDLYQAGITLATFLIWLVVGYHNIFVIFLISSVLGYIIFNRKKLPSILIYPGLIKLNGYSTILNPLINGFFKYQLSIFLYFLKLGFVTFGGGLVIMPIIESELVKGNGWLTKAEFIEGIGFGQITPGPLINSVVYYGYKIGENLSINPVLSSFLAALGIVLPAIIIVLAVTPFWMKINKVEWVKAVFKGLLASVFGLLLVFCVTLAEETFLDLYTVIMFFLSFVVLALFRINYIYLFVANGIIGFSCYMLFS